jgi:hypothetical protein
MGRCEIARLHCARAPLREPKLGDSNVQATPIAWFTQSSWHPRKRVFLSAVVRAVGLQTNPLPHPCIGILRVAGYRDRQTAVVLHTAAAPNAATSFAPRIPVTVRMLRLQASGLSQRSRA